MKSAGKKSGKVCGNPGRRVFLVDSEKILKYLAILSLLLPALRFLGFTVPPKPKYVTVNKPLKAGGFIIEPDFILFDNGLEALAVSRTCTHLGCKLNYHELEGQLICPCHKSRFSRAGQRLGGPARLDLPTYGVATTSDGNGNGKVTGYIVTII
jgi:nitrite reductase/ring-hydroxylating ferredoxin subunit